MLVRKILCLLAASFLCLTSAWAAPAKSLGDLNKVESLSFPVLSAESGGKVFFLHFTEAEGGELWITDGTPEGTSLLKDIAPGQTSSLPMGFAPATIGGQPGVYFAASTPATGLELWFSDGTAGGTQMVEDIYPGASSGVSASGGFGVPRIVTDPASSFAFFGADDGANGRELWFSSDATAGGTYMIKDLNPGASDSDPEELKYVPELPLLFFSATVSGVGREPYYTNGGLNFAPLIANINPGAGSSSPERFTWSTAGNKLLFVADDGTSGEELWQSGMTTTIVSDLTPGADDSLIFELVPLASGEVMFSRLSVSALTLEIEQYLSDGTAGGTSSFKTLNCLPGSVLSVFLGATLSQTTLLNGHAVFPCQEITNFNDALTSLGTEMWVSDGTGPSTQILKDIFPGDAPSGAFGNMQVSGGLVFTANDGQHGSEPWFTDGTEAGTSLLTDLNPGEASSFDPQLLIYYLLQVQNPSATANVFIATVGNERKLIYTDGTAANTRAIVDLFSESTSNSQPTEYFALGGGPLTLFAATHGAKGRELYVTSGKKKGTRILKNIFKSGDSVPMRFVKLKKGEALFSAISPQHGRELWFTDGTKKGTRRVKDINAGVASSQPTFFSGKRKGKLFFSAIEESTGQELWITNGRKNGTKLVKDIKTGADPGTTSNGVVFNNKLFFAADDGINGQELWTSDGTEAGTTLFKNIYPGATGSSPFGFTVLGNQLYFAASSMSFGTEIWVSDGTAAGTKQVKDINPGVSGSNPSLLVAGDSVVFFRATDGTHGEELWRTDGTAAGTILIRDIDVGASGAGITELVALPGNQVIFNADNNLSGTEPWRAGAGAGSAALLKNIVAGASGSSPANFYRLPGRNQVVFSASSDAAGNEIWITDGTSAGTTLLEDLIPGTGGSSPSEFYFRGRKLFFSANLGTEGEEPFVMQLP